MKFMGRRVKLRSFDAGTREGRCPWCDKKLTKAQRDDYVEFCRPSCAYQFGERLAELGVRLTDDGKKIL